jgi:hypothetical protein
VGTPRIDSIEVKLSDKLATARHRPSGVRPALSQVIERLRRRWRLRLLLNGLFQTLAPMIALLVISAWCLHYWHYASNAIWLFRFVTIFALVGLILHFCLVPLRRQVSDARVALYLEENEPSLGSVVISAVDARQAVTREPSPQLVTRLVEQALDACERVHFGRAVEGKKIRHAASKLGLVLLVGAGLYAAPFEFLHRGASALLMPWTEASQYSPYRIELAPGDVEIARGSDQLISARIDGFDGDEVLLYSSDDGGVSWQQTVMASAGKIGSYESFLFDLDHPVDYYVTATSQQSETYRIDVADIPAISKISLRYHFPAYTQLEPETSQGSGDISALRGTRVEVRIKPTIEIPGGVLLLNNGQRIELVKNDKQGWTGEITVEQNSGYKVGLQRANGIRVDASPEFRITALDDRHPTVTILSPGRDMKVSMIEEPVMRVRAADDQGIAQLELVLSVNGTDEQRLKLMQSETSPGANRQLDAEHITYLEELDLRPGDLISYYLHTEDRGPGDQSRSATSDIFFYQVRPFSTNYRRADQQGGGGGGQGGQQGQQQGHLSDQQKQFVVATFKMIRDRDKYDSAAYQDNLDLLAKAQSRIRDRVEAIVRRIANRPIVQADQGYQVIAEELPLAAEAMVVVEEKLEQTEINQALSSAQIALRHLQIADAAFREINVSLGNRGGGGAGNNAGFDDLADLFRLEMDKLRNQYETVQRGQQQSSAQVIDETLERLRELAHRQQREVERQMRRQQQSSNNDPNSKQLALADELEEMARQLEKLSRTQPNPQLQQSINQMRGAAQAMRGAATSASGGGIDRARQAGGNLREAQRLLDQSRVWQFGEEVEQTLRRARLLEKRQAAIKQEVIQLNDEWGEALREQLEQLGNHKQTLSGELVDLEAEIGNLATTAREQQPQASQRLKQAIWALRENRLHDRIARTRDMVHLGEKERAIDNETEIHDGIVEVREHIESALTNLGEQNARGLQQSLDRMRALARELQFLRERTSSDAENRGAETATPGQASNGGNQAISRKLEGIAARAGEIGERLLEQGVAAGDIGPVLNKIKQLRQAQNDPDNAASADLYDQALSALMELEYKLRKQQSDPEFPELLVAESIDIPDDYKEMVADYFRDLSRH